MKPPLTLYFDGRCPLCCAEMMYLQSRDRQQNLAFVDARQEGALNAVPSVSCQAAMANIHALTSEGELLIGVAAFERAYQMVGLRFLAYLLGRPALKPLLDVGYTFFATHRYKISKYLGPLALFWVKRVLKIKALNS
jgi:predicted DCC family thiol-disulfide oxidoreductase YuxK